MSDERQVAEARESARQFYDEYEGERDFESARNVVDFAESFAEHYAAPLHARIAELEAVFLCPDGSTNALLANLLMLTPTPCRERLTEALIDRTDAGEKLRKRIAELEQQQREDQEMIRILWKTGEFSGACGNALSEDGVIRRALAAKEGK